MGHPGAGLMKGGQEDEMGVRDYFHIAAVSARKALLRLSHFPCFSQGLRVRSESFR